MAAGISKEEKYRIEFRLLHRIQRDLEKVGIDSTYRNRRLFGTHAGKPWWVCYEWLYASNGETCGIPYIQVDGKTAKTHLGSCVVEYLSRALIEPVEA